MANTPNLDLEKIVAGYLPWWSNAHSNLDKIDAVFHATTGHKHTGVAGDGTKVDHSQLLNTHNLTTDIDHGSISGLADDDHTQYLLIDGSRAMTGNITMVDDKWIGLGSAKGRIVFDDTPATDEITVISALLKGTDLTFAGTGTFGDLNVDTTTLVTDSENNRVGIGTASPNSAFHIKAGVSGVFGQIIIQNPADDVTSNAAITAYESDGSGNPDQQLWYLGSLSSSNNDIGFLNRQNGAIHFYTNNAFKMIIDATGNVGIGTTEPGGALAIKDPTTYIDRDGLCNMTFTDPQTGTKKLSELAAGKDTFAELNDTPADYSGEAGKSVFVKPTEDGLCFSAINNWLIPMFFVPTADIVVGANVTYEVYAPVALEVDKVFIHSKVAPGSGKTVTVDVNKNGATIFATQGNRPSIVGTSKFDESGTPDTVSFAKNDIITIDIDVATAAHEMEDMTIQFRSKQA